MAIDYAKVLKALNVDMVVIGRGQASALQFENMTGLPVQTGGIEKWLLHKKNLPCQAIVAVGERLLGKVGIMLMEHGIKSLLVEKPGAATTGEVADVLRKAQEHNSKVYLAYNRRFYASVQQARQIIREDGGVTSFYFEFTEWSHVIKDLQKEPGVRENWLFHNSTHVIDLAFHLGGKPKDISCYTAGALNWHPASSIFAGAGASDRGALFSYNANWESPGRWGVEVLTRKHRLIFRPLEKLQIQKIGSIAVELLDIDDRLDVEYKPGLFKQTQAFINGDTQHLCTIEEQANMVNLYNKIANYP